MGQFYDTYRGNPKLATLLRELGCSHHMTIIGRAQSDQEREFYLQAATAGRWSKRELERQLDGGLYQRTLTNPAQLSPALHHQHPTAPHLFRDSYLLDFLNLPSTANTTCGAAWSRT